MRRKYGATSRNVTPYGQTVEDNVIEELKGGDQYARDVADAMSRRRPKKE